MVYTISKSHLFFFLAALGLCWGFPDGSDSKLIAPLVKNLPAVQEWASEVTQSCPTLCDPVDCSPLGSSVHGILQARIVEWVAIFPCSIPGLGRSPGEGNGNPLQYSCLENPMDRGAWWATVHGVAKSWTWLSDFTFSKMQLKGMLSSITGTVVSWRRSSSITGRTVSYRP